MDAEAYKTMAENERIHWWFCGRRAILLSILKKINKNKVARALDIGSGTGGSMRDLAVFAQEVRGLEPSAEAIVYLRSNYPDLNVIQGVFPEEMPDGQYNLITMFDVLEHIKDDRAAIGALSNLLAPGGMAVITVPAFPVLWSQHDEYLRHFRRYTISGLKTILAGNNNLSISHIHYYNSLLFAPIFLIRLFHKIFKTNQRGDDKKIPNKFINRFLQAIFSLERFWLPNWSLPFGVSIICIIKKKQYDHD